MDCNTNSNGKKNVSLSHFCQWGHRNDNCCSKDILEILLGLEHVVTGADSLFHPHLQTTGALTPFFPFFHHWFLITSCRHAVDGYLPVIQTK